VRESGDRHNFYMMSAHGLSSQYIFSLATQNSISCSWMTNVDDAFLE